MRSLRWIAGASWCALALACLAQAPSKKGTAAVKMTAFGTTSDGKPVDLYTLSNANGMSVAIMTYGGTVVSLTAPDRAGKFADVVLGMDNVAGYQGQTAFFGALIGRYGNRIGHARFQLDGKTYQLPKNDGDNILHGGPRASTSASGRCTRPRVWRAMRQSC